MPPTVTIVEVGPRDGLQNEAAAVQTVDKVAFVNLLSASGLPVIEVSAFVSPKWVPQMADAGGVFAGISRRPGVRYPALVPNLGGLERAHAAGVTEIAIFAAASETFSRRNINQGIEASLDTYRSVCERAAALGIPVRAYVSTAFGCPFEGPVTSGTRRLRLPGARRDGRVSSVCERHHRHRASRTDSRRAERRGRPRAAGGDRPALSRHSRYCASERPHGAPDGRDDFRFVRGRARRLSLRARSDRQSRH